MEWGLWVVQGDLPGPGLLPGQSSPKRPIPPLFIPLGPRSGQGRLLGCQGTLGLLAGCPHVCASKALVAPGGAGTEGRERASCGSAATPPAPAMSWWISRGQNATCEPGFQTAVKLYLSREDTKHISFTNLLVSRLHFTQTFMRAFGAWASV